MSLPSTHVMAAKAGTLVMYPLDDLQTHITTNDDVVRAEASTMETDHKAYKQRLAVQTVQDDARKAQRENLKKQIRGMRFGICRSNVATCGMINACAKKDKDACHGLCKWTEWPVYNRKI